MLFISKLLKSSYFSLVSSTFSLSWLVKFKCRFGNYKILFHYLDENELKLVIRSWDAIKIMTKTLKNGLSVG